MWSGSCDVGGTVIVNAWIADYCIVWKGWVLSDTSLHGSMGLAQIINNFKSLDWKKMAPALNVI